MITQPDWHPTSTKLQQFGVVLWVGFGLIGALAWWRGHEHAACWVWGMAGVIGLIAVVRPPASKPFYWLWMGLGYAMGQVTSRIVMALIFYGILTPLAIIFRLLRRDVLRRKPEKEVTSYWTDHPEISKENYKRLF